MITPMNIYGYQLLKPILVICNFLLHSLHLIRMFLALLLDTRTGADEVQPSYSSFAGNNRNRVTTSRHRYVFYFSHIVVDFQQRCACSQ